MACIPDAQQTTQMNRMDETNRTDQMEASAIPEPDRGYRKAVFPLPDGRQLVLTIYGDIVYGDEVEGWSATDVRVFTPDGKHSNTLALVMYRHNRGSPGAQGEFTVMAFDDERAFPKYKP